MTTATTQPDTPAARDPNIWRELPFTLDNGYVPAVPRRWMFVGNRRGEQCRFPCQLSERHPTLPNVYRATAIFAHNAHYLCNEWVRLDELEETEFYNGNHS